MTTTSSSWGFTNRSNTTASFPTTSTKILYTNDVRTITAIFSLLIVVGVYLTVSLIIFSRRVKYVQNIVCQKNSAAKERFDTCFSGKKFDIFCFVLLLYKKKACLLFCR